MANVKNPTRGQRAKTIKIDEAITEAELEEITEPKKLKREVKMSDEVLVMNNTSGQLVMISTPTRRQWMLKEYGKKARMTVSDIIDITSDQPIIFEDGWAIILDEDVVNYLNYDEIYKNLLTNEQMLHLEKLTVKELEEILPKLPETLKIDISRMVKQKVADGIIDSRSKIEIFKKHLKFRLD